MEKLKEKIENLSSLKPEALQDIIKGMLSRKAPPWPSMITKPNC